MINDSNVGTIGANFHIMDGYHFGKIDETISRIDKKLEDLCLELKSLNTMLENYHDK